MNTILEIATHEKIFHCINHGMILTFHDIFIGLLLLVSVAQDYMFHNLTTNDMDL